VLTAFSPVCGKAHQDACHVWNKTADRSRWERRLQCRAGGTTLRPETDLFEPRRVAIVRAAVLLSASVVAGGTAFAQGQTLTGALIALTGVCYVALTLVVKGLHEPDSPHDTVVTVGDVLLVTAVVWITGGTRSEFYLLYYLPLIQAGLRLNTRDGIAASVLVGALYGFVALTRGAQGAVLTSGGWRVVTVCVSAVVMVIFFSLLKRQTGLSDSLRSALHSYLRRVAAVYDVAHAANKGADPEEVLSILLDHAARATGAEAGAIALLRADGSLRPMTAHGAAIEGRAVVNCTSEEARRAIAEKLPVTGTAPASRGDQPATDPPKVIYVPLMSLGMPIGVLGLTFRSSRKFGRNQLEFLKSLSSEAVIAIENAQLRAELRRMAITDGLTGLLNRRESERRLQQELERAERYGRPLAALMIDVDDLKLVNDQLGHPLGDEVLSALSRVLGRNTRSADIAGRMGGDEFLVVLPETDVVGAAALAERLLSDFRAELKALPSLRKASALAGISIGVASSRGLDRADRDLVAVADQALYAAKNAGKNRTHVAGIVADVTPAGANAVGTSAG